MNRVEWSQSNATPPCSDTSSELVLEGGAAQWEKGRERREEGNEGGKEREEEGKEQGRQTIQKRRESLHSKCSEHLHSKQPQLI